MVRTENLADKENDGVAAGPELADDLEFCAGKLAKIAGGGGDMDRLDDFALKLDTLPDKVTGGEDVLVEGWEGGGVLLSAGAGEADGHLPRVPSR